MQDSRWLFFFSMGNGQFTEGTVFSDPSIVLDGYVDNTSPWRHPIFDIADFDGDGYDDLCVSMRRRVNYHGPNYDDWTYVGICRRDYLIRSRKDTIEVRCVSKLNHEGDDIMIDSIKWNTFDAIIQYHEFPYTPMYNVNAFLTCVGMHKGVSPHEILYSRMSFFPPNGNPTGTGAVFHVTGFLDNTSPNVIERVIDGLGATREIQYDPHSFQYPYSNAFNNGNSKSRTLPQGVVLFRGRLEVVQKVLEEMVDATPNTPKVFRETKYHFSEALFHTRGRGLLCFAKIWKRMDL